MASSTHNVANGNTSTLTSTRATAEPQLVCNFILMGDTLRDHAISVGFTPVQCGWMPINFALSLDNPDFRTMMRNRPFNSKAN